MNYITPAMAIYDFLIEKTKDIDVFKDYSFYISNSPFIDSKQIIVYDREIGQIGYSSVPIKNISLIVRTNDYAEGYNVCKILEKILDTDIKGDNYLITNTQPEGIGFSGYLNNEVMSFSLLFNFIMEE